MDAFTKIKLTRNTLDKIEDFQLKFISEHSTFFDVIPENDIEHATEYLYFDSNDLRLKYHFQELGNLFFNFKEEVNYHRHQRYSLSKEPLAKALGINSKNPILVWDTTCGTAKDAILMSHFGAKVVAFERHPLVFLLLIDANRVWPTSIEFLFGDSLDYLSSEKERPNVVYYDPMYPEKKKSALPRKEMQIFKNLIGPDNDSEAFLKEVMQFALDRVVVKRSLHAPKILENTTANYVGKSTRYDMYKIFR
jgi:16S rRNA (guanine1516-N2)-methyltransferase